jgi:hypothetical protein
MGFIRFAVQPYQVLKIVKNGNVVGVFVPKFV